MNAGQAKAAIVCLAQELETLAITLTPFIDPKTEIDDASQDLLDITVSFKGWPSLTHHPGHFPYVLIRWDQKLFKEHYTALFGRIPFRPLSFTPNEIFPLITMQFKEKLLTAFADHLSEADALFRVRLGCVVEESIAALMNVRVRTESEFGTRRSPYQLLCERIKCWKPKLAAVNKGSVVQLDFIDRELEWLLPKDSLQRIIAAAATHDSNPTPGQPIDICLH